MTDIGVPGLTGVSLVGKGGTASVYRGLDPNGAHVAVKVFSGVWDEDRQRRLDREVKAIQSLEDVEGVVDILGHGETSNGAAFLIMPYYERGSLQDLLDSEGPLTETTATTYIQQIAQTLCEAHKRAIFHRDLKPANILLSPEGLPVLADFGTTEIPNGRTATTITPYTAGYCPPETMEKGIKGTDGEKADIYALGATFWSLLTARRPFYQPGENTVEMRVLFNRVFTERLATVGDCSIWVNSIIDLATETDPNERYKSVNEMSTDLEAKGKQATGRKKASKSDPKKQNKQTQTSSRQSESPLKKAAETGPLAFFSQLLGRKRLVPIVAILALLATAGFLQSQQGVEATDPVGTTAAVSTPEETSLTTESNDDTDPELTVPKSPAVDLPEASLAEPDTEDETTPSASEDKTTPSAEAAAGEAKVQPADQRLVFRADEPEPVDPEDIGNVDPGLVNPSIGELVVVAPTFVPVDESFPGGPAIAFGVTLEVIEGNEAFLSSGGACAQPVIVNRGPGFDRVYSVTATSIGTCTLTVEQRPSFGAVAAKGNFSVGIRR